MSQVKLVTFVISILSLSSVELQAEIVHFAFGLDPGQEVQTPAVVSDGFGSGMVMYDTVTNQFDWSISYQDLETTVSMAHFHGPAAPGANAGIILGISGATGTTSGLLNGSASWPEAQEQALLDGLVYANIHTTGYTAGEIRGQVVPEPATLVILLAGAAGLLGAHRSRKL